MKGRRGKHAIEPEVEADVSPTETPADAEVEPGGHRLGEMAVARGLVTAGAVRAALQAKQAGTLDMIGDLLVRQGHLAEWDLTALLAEQYGVPLGDLRESVPEPAALDLLNSERARHLSVLPLIVADEAVRVAVSDPRPAHLAQVEQAMGRKVLPVVVSLPSLRRALDSAYSAISAVDQRVKEFEQRDSLRREAARLEAATANDEAPVVQVVQMIITQALRDRSSDIHIEPTGDRVRVRYRIDGALHEVLSLPGSIGPALVSRIKILAGMNIVERRRAQDGQTAVTVDDRAVDIRVATTAVVGGEKVVMRLLDKSRPIYELEKLGMSHDVTERYHDLLKSPYGMVICAGPTGSGKTTTLYASLGELNSPDRNIMTIEDPVEYTISTINQISINEQAGINFANGLRSILRQDPDVILVGEVRDVETARIAVQSALTGHFVLSSLHATDTVAALHRLLDMGIENFLVASAVTAVVAQRLMRRNCPYCIETYELGAEERTFFMGGGGVAPEAGFKHGAGCNFCAHTGYFDRIGVYELLTISDGIRELILDRGSHHDLRKLAVAEGMQTLQQQAMKLVEAGITTPAEAMRTVYVAGG
ncbi:MAG TPA: ATPase, T2SS/T4P/T4SS family [Jatrophihabitans sp.]|jgi:type IV pilus assembly protein PilB